MWLHEIPVGGMLFSPMVLLVLLALTLTLMTYLLLRQLGWHRQVWKGAWFYLSLFVCFVALSLRLLS
ncbi:DUF1656 domain-containing protein [Alcanivorax sp.]|jgi:hypothetical protein|uniref:DUF1656 domain-containing protein n=1 Tax=Alcanivorax sp. TaxID=1872427 RepID=UPI000C3C787C|nr:DUF1656 domain-containing protein [Alcanivorax sp.]MBQ24472.1 DUF1656 domain-containing protein [Alcanivorax sp.]|tara:strand:+ start:197 stop:397 length:201 start_codon:yes stop_codon:yes gene_type:complete